MKEYTINIIYGGDSLEELIIKSIIKDIQNIINKNKLYDTSGELNCEQKK